MKALAAILIKKKKIQIKEIKIPNLSFGQLLIKIEYSSICHTQMQEIYGLRGKDNFLPHCLGHEATGIVIKKDSSVKKFKINDKVCLSWVPSKGKNGGGSIYYDGKGKKINAGPVNTFSTYAIVSENKIHKLDNKANMKNSVLLGCALPTAYNCIFSNTSNQKNKKILIVGCGGVGLSIIHACKMVNFKQITVIDKDNSKIKKAIKLGAHNHISKSNYNNFSNYFDYVVECTGNKDLLNFSIKFAKQFGGQLIIVGNYIFNTKLQIDPWEILFGKTITGSWSSKFDYRKNFKKYEKYSKKFNSSLLFGKKVYKFNNFLKAVEDFKNGRVIRPVIKFN